ncbi:MAG: amidohydrolase family protein [Kiritimatiellae bacterium]|nr:amidohydrolase family protein [Kiritimatiellia bacterium]
MKFLDCNCSYGRAARPPFRFAADVPALLAAMDWCGIERALVYHASQRFSSPVTWNPVVAEETGRSARLWPSWAMLPSACGELPAPDDLVAAMQRRNVRALWAFPQEHHYRLDRQSFPDLFRLMAEQRIPLFAKENLAALKELLVECPELIVVAMNQGPHSLNRHLFPLMDAFPNLLLDTSHLLVEGAIEAICERYGPERLLFGSAFPDNCAGGARLRLAHADIGAADRAAIAGGNLERLLGWCSSDSSDRSGVSDHCAREIANPSALAAAFMANGRTPTCPIVDLHGHWGPFGGSHLPCACEEKMLDTLRRRGVVRIVCSDHEALFGDPELGNRRMQAAMDRHPDVLSGYWAVNPNYPDLARKAPEDLERSRGFVGFKLLPDYHVYPLTGDRYAAALDHADSRRRLVLVHTWGGSAFNSPRMLEALALKYPGAFFLMGHSGYGDWDAALGIGRDLPNVYLDSTAVYVAHDFAMQPNGSGTPAALMSCLHVNGIIERMVETAGSRKIVFGTDLPWYSPHFAAGAVLYAHIADDARQDILHRNAERLLGAAN